MTRVQAQIETSSGDIQTYIVPVESNQSIKKQVISFVENKLNLKFLKGFVIKDIMAL